MTKSDHVLLGLAPNTLKEFLEPGSTRLDPKIFRKMSSVTALVLISKALDFEADCTPLQRLPLERLILIDCPCADSAILAPGALTGLKWLHIDGCEREHEFIADSPSSDAEDVEEEGYYTDNSIYIESEGDKMSSILQDLPHLKFVSGRSELFIRGMSEFPEDWQLVWHEDHDCAVWSNKERSDMPVWSKL